MEQSQLSGKDVREKKNGSSTNEKLSEVVESELAIQLTQLREEKEQMKYEFMRKIDSLEANEKYYTDEIEYWKTENDKLKNQLKCQSAKFEEEKIRRKNAQTEETTDLYQNIHQLEVDNAKLKKQLEDFQNRSIVENNDYERVQELEAEISELKEKLRDMTIVFNVSEAKCQELEDRNMVILQENQEYQQSLDLKRNELKKSNAIIMELQDEVTVLRKELFEIENQPRDINTRGNSLFAEVYDSRNRIKEQFNKLAAKYNRTMKEKESLAAEVEILRSEIYTLRDIFNKEMKDFKPGNMFELTGDSASMSAMRTLVESYKEEIDRLTMEEPPAERDYKYYEAVIQRQRKEMEKLRATLSDHSLTHSMRARKVSEMGCHLAFWKSRSSEFESEKRFLDLKVQELENKILDLQSELNKPEEKKEENTKVESTTVQNKQQQKPEPKQPPKIDVSEKGLIERYGPDKVQIISREEMDAIMQKKPFIKKETENCTNGENKENESSINKNEDNNEKEKKATEESVKEGKNILPTQDMVEFLRKKKTVQFAEESKKEDGEKRRPRGKHSYVINLETKEVKKVN